MPCILALDQGTSSSRAIVFDATGEALASAQLEFRQSYPTPGRVEHDPVEIWHTQLACAREALARAGLAASDVVAIGIANQRETTVLWNRSTGAPLAPAIVWQDRRTVVHCDALRAAGHAGLIRARSGLELDAYFSATKLAWLLDNVPGARHQAEAGELAFGTIDSWLVWQLTGGRRHVTDLSNASRTMLFDIHRQCWSDDLLALFDIPRTVLPEVVASSGVLGETDPALFGAPIPIGGLAGDQQAATFGQAAFAPGNAKHTFGTGGFLIVNTGEEPVFSGNGLLTTVAYRVGDQKPVYALEGSVAVAGSLHHWLRDNLGMLRDSTEIEGLASSVPDTGGAFIVPAFSGLFAPRWQPDARGVIVGLTRFVTRAHLVRAASEASVYQTIEVIEAAAADTGVRLGELRVDGGGSVSDMMMQFQADMLGIDVVRPEILETTALGAAFAAGLATGVWSSLDELGSLVREGRRWVPRMGAEDRDRRLRLWNRAVERSLGWVDDDVRAYADGEPR